MFQNKLQAARRSGKVFCAASIDLTNTFGSIPHRASSSALNKAGVGKFLKTVASDLLDEACTLVASSADMFGPVRIRRAVRQGDPLSGLVFNFAFNPVIRAFFAVKGVTVLVFVDDILIIADSPELLQTALDILKEQWLSFHSK